MGLCVLFPSDYSKFIVRRRVDLIYILLAALKGYAAGRIIRRYLRCYLHHFQVVSNLKFISDVREKPTCLETRSKLCSQPNSKSSSAFPRQQLKRITENVILLRIDLLRGHLTGYVRGLLRQSSSDDLNDIIHTVFSQPRKSLCPQLPTWLLKI